MGARARHAGPVHHDVDAIVHGRCWHERDGGDRCAAWWNGGRRCSFSRGGAAGPCSVSGEGAGRELHL